MVRIRSVESGSRAEKAGVMAGDILLSIDGHEIKDVLDYRFYLAERKITLLLHRGPALLTVPLSKGEYEDIGLEFDSFLMDDKKSCRNGCVFCFIDQNPPGMRETIYFKDDDSRLSFLQGNYVTLTNMGEEDIRRIIDMHMSPVNISVHTTNPALRVKMMKNRFAGNILETMRRFAEAGIQMNAQLVICKGLNDGAELDRSMRELAPLYPALQSVAVVPAGLTCHREKLYPLEGFSPEDSRRMIGQVNAAGEKFLAQYGTRLFYAADESYVKAGLPLPGPEYYDGYPQLENGVGLMACMREEFDAAIACLDGYELTRPRKLSIATGEAAYDFICSLAGILMRRVPALDCRVYRVKNDFFGHSVTVAGLVCGCDIIAQLRGKELGDKLILPEVMLRAEKDLFLDGSSIADVEKALGVPVELSECTGDGFVQSLLS